MTRRSNASSVIGELHFAPATSRITIRLTPRALELQAIELISRVWRLFRKEITDAQRETEQRV